MGAPCCSMTGILDDDPQQQFAMPGFLIFHSNGHEVIFHCGF